MAVSKKILHEEIKTRYVSIVSAFLDEQGEEVLRTGSNKIAIPVTDKEGNEEFVEIVFKVPLGERDGDPYDGYGEAETYAMKVKAKAEKTEAAAKKKAEKIAKDAKRRVAKEAQKNEMP